MKQMAHISGRTDAERKYSEVFDKIRAAFNKAYVHDDGFVGGGPPPPVFGSGGGKPMSGKPVETQAGYVLALHMKLPREHARQLAGRRLVDRTAAQHGRRWPRIVGTP